MSATLEWNIYFEVLKRSNAPTLVVEGRDDYVCFRSLEERLIDQGFTVFPVNGKSNLLEIVRRRAEVENRQIVFLLDRDEWLFFGAPHEFVAEDVILTDGWSIENDILRGGGCGDLMTPQEREIFTRELANFANIFSAILQDFLDLEPVAPFSMSVHPANVLSDDGELSEEAAEFFEGRLIDDQILTILRNDYHRSIRGKSLLALYTRRLSHRARVSKYSRMNIIELCSVARGPYLIRLENEIQERLGL